MPRHHRIKCPNCGRLNERRLETCYFCTTPIYHGWLDYLKRKLRKIFGYAE